MSNASQLVGDPLALYLLPGTLEGAAAPPQRASLACRDLEEVIEAGLALLAVFRASNERWADAVRAGRTGFSWDEARQLANRFQWWLDRSRPVLDWLDQCEKAGSRVRRAAEFRDAWREVSLMSLDVDRARQAIDSLDRGEGIPFDQAMHGLRNRLR